MEQTDGALLHQGSQNIPRALQTICFGQDQTRPCFEMPSTWPRFFPPILCMNYLKFNFPFSLFFSLFLGQARVERLKPEDYAVFGAPGEHCPFLFSSSACWPICVFAAFCFSLALCLMLPFPQSCAIRTPSSTAQALMWSPRPPSRSWRTARETPTLRASLSSPRTSAPSATRVNK
jgi:hypothetical protein